jgi:ABC-type polysaccharide/polyol phosphate transport system ATPase subunit
MCFDEIAINVVNLSKRYEIYKKPIDRLKQLLATAIYSFFLKLSAMLNVKLSYQPPKYYREFWALHDVSFQMLRGETVGIIGLNGSGKSTLLQLICSTLTPTSGDAIVNGRVAALLELGSGFNPDFTGRENVFLNGQILGLSRRDVQDRLQAIEEFADIGDFIDQPVKTYSSGMVVRLAFVVVVYVEPEILVVDEALAVGDMTFQVKCFAHLRKLRDKGTSILFVSHSLSTVRSFCDRVVYLDHGKCAAFGLANDICRQYELNCIKDKLLPSEIEEIKVNYSKNVTMENRELVSSEVLKYLQANSAIFKKKKHEGSQSLTIESFIITGEDHIPLEYINPRQIVTAYAVLRLNRQLSNDLHFSIQIHDRQGMPLMVVRDSEFEGVVTGNKDDTFVVSMIFSLPLQEGQYYCQAGLLMFPLGQKYPDNNFNFESAEIADIVEHAAYFQISPYRRHPIPLPILNESKMKVSAIKGIS